MKPDTPIYFAAAAEFRAWLEAHGAAAEFLWVGFHKAGTGRASMSWPESVDEALCFGWIDGLRKRIDAARYVIRFTPRRRAGVWSAVNIRRMQELMAGNLVQAAGLRAFEARRENRSGIYSYEQRPQELPEPYLKKLRRDRAAASFFSAQSASYRRACIWWVISAKQEATRERRLALLMQDSAAHRQIKQFRALRPAQRDAAPKSARPKPKGQLTPRRRMRDL